MSSLLTNTSAMTALQSLSQTQKNLSTVQNQISTGLAISSAADNASYWSIATKMSSNVGALGAVSSSLSESAAMVSTMSTALTAAISVMDVIKNDLVGANNPGTDLTKVQTDITAQVALLKSIGNSSNFNGQNFLATAGVTSLKLVSAYDSASGLSYITLNTTKTALFSISGSTYGGNGILDKAGASSSTSIMNFNVSGATSGKISNMLTDLETALSSVTSSASTLGATSTSIGTQQQYISNLADSLTTGIGSLVDANMNEASTKLSALQVQQQLGIQALSIANTNTQMILKLFGG